MPAPAVVANDVGRLPRYDPPPPYERITGEGGEMPVEIGA